MQICTRGPRLLKIDVLVYPLPYLWVQRAATQRVERGACLDCEIDEDESGMMYWEAVVDGIGEDFVAVVEEENKEEDC